MSDRRPQPRRPPNEPLSFGAYDVLEERARGATSVVYRARHRRLGRVVALKVFDARAAERGDAVERFRREARLLARLDHENVVRCFDFGEDADGRLYLVLEYVDGESLHDRLRREGRLEVDEALRIALEAARGLGAAHRLGVVHRDVKPGNVLLAGDGRVKLGDFGLARAEGSLELTRAGALVGTPQYLAPEQLRDPRRAGPRADVYGLGATLFHALTGRPPHGGATIAESVASALNEPAPNPGRLRADLPARVVVLLSELMAADPRRRPADGDEAARAIERVLCGEGPRSFPALRWRRRTAPARWHRRAAGVVLLLAALALASWLLAGRGRDGTPTVRPAAQRAAAPLEGPGNPREGEKAASTGGRPDRGSKRAESRILAPSAPRIEEPPAPEHEVGTSLPPESASSAPPHPFSAERPPEPREASVPPPGPESAGRAEEAASRGGVISWSALAAQADRVWPEVRREMLARLLRERGRRVALWVGGILREGTLVSVSPERGALTFEGPSFEVTVDRIDPSSFEEWLGRALPPEWMAVRLERALGPEAARDWLAARIAGGEGPGGRLEALLQVLEERCLERGRRRAEAERRIQRRLERAEEALEAGDPEAAEEALSDARRVLGESSDRKFAETWRPRLRRLSERVSRARRALETRRRLAGRYAGRLAFGRDGAALLAYDFVSREEADDFVGARGAFVVREGALESRDPLEHRDRYAGDALLLRLPFDGDRDVEVTVELEFPYEWPDPALVGFRLGRACFAVRSFGPSDERSHGACWLGDLLDFKGRVFEPALGETAPTRRDARPVAWFGFERGGRYVVSLSCRPARAARRYEWRVDGRLLHRIEEERGAAPVEWELRSGTALRILSLRARGTVSEAAWPP